MLEAILIQEDLDVGRFLHYVRFVQDIPCDVCKRKEEVNGENPVVEWFSFSGEMWDSCVDCLLTGKFDDNRVKAIWNDEGEVSNFILED